MLNLNNDDEIEYSLTLAISDGPTGSLFNYSPLALLE